MAKSTAIARRSPSPALARAKEATAKARGTLAKYRRQSRESKVPNALMAGGATLAGGAVVGVTRGFIGDEVAGIPVEPIIAAIAGTAGIALGQPLLIHAGAGALTPYLADFIDDAITDARQSAGA